MSHLCSTQADLSVQTESCVPPDVSCVQSRGKSPAAYDPLRTLRMFGFGLCWYGPYQFYWYNLLDYFMPLKTTANFLTKVSEGCMPAAVSTTGTCSVNSYWPPCS